MNDPGGAPRPPRGLWARILGWLGGTPAGTRDRERELSPWSTAPHGQVLIHTAGSTIEADYLRQLLVDNGFPIEYVPTAGAGVFGVTGSSYIYAPTEIADEAREFLEAYLDAPPADDVPPEQGPPE